MSEDRLYDIPTERVVLKKLIKDKPFLHSAYLYKKVILDHFADLFHRDAYKSIMDFYAKYGKPPSKKHLQKLILKNITYKKDKFKKEAQQDIWIKSIDRLYLPFTELEEDSITADVSNLDEMRKARLLRKSLIQSDKHFEDGDYDKAFALMTVCAMKSRMVEQSITEGNIVDDMADHLKIMEQKEKGIVKQFKSGIEGIQITYTAKEPDDVKFGKRICLDDYVGFNRGEMTLLIGENNIGKSFFLMETCFSIAKFNKTNVILFTIEMNKEKQQNRIYSRLTDIPYLKFKNAELTTADKKKWKDRIDRWKDENGIFHVVSFDQGATVPDIKHKLADVENQYGQPFDMIAIDYLNDMKPMGSYSSDRDWAAYGEISLDLSNLSKYHHNHEGIIVITANQKKASSSRNSKVIWQDAAFSPLPSQHATIGIGLYQLGADIAQDNRIRWNIWKNRDGEKSIKFMTFPRFHVSRISSGTKIDDYFDLKKDSMGVKKNGK